MDILFRGQNEQLWFSNTDGLVFSDLTGRKKRLTEGKTDFFDLAYSGEVNVVYVSHDGKLIRLERRVDSWVKTVILKSKSGEMGIFGLRLIVSEDKLNLIYGLIHNGEKMIVHQVLPGGEPLVVNTCGEGGFFVRRDETGCIYVVCNSIYGGWEMSVFRSTGWNRPEKIINEGIIRDIIFTGYKEYCTVTEINGKLMFNSSDCEFEVFGKKPSIVKSDDSYVVISEDSGEVFYTDRSGKNKIISGTEVRNFYVRFPFSAEYDVCDRCRGRVAFSVPKLFLIDRVGKNTKKIQESAKLELLKRIIALEERIVKIEETIKQISLQNPQ